MPKITADTFIQILSLARHPEGGWYGESYRATEMIPATSLPGRYGGDRSFCTAIYFLLQQGEVSCLHRIKSDELWHFYGGGALTVHVLTPEGSYYPLMIGSNLAAGEVFQAVVPAGCWFGAEVSAGGEYSLVGCTVAPGFDFADFELGQPDVLLQQFPQHGEIVSRLTRTKTV